MPGKTLGASTETSSSPNFGSLKGHKPFPRRKHVVSGTIPTRPIDQEHSIRRHSDRTAYSAAERIQSWIPEPSPIQVIPVAGQPLTPPINFRDDFQSWIDDAELRSHTFNKKPSSQSTGTTPLVRQSPPTPESTPPRIIHRTRARVSLPSSHNPSENRTDSFTTAKENQSSDDEIYRMDSPSLHPARQNWLRATGLAKHKDVGLGLGLESDDEESTAKETTSRNSPKHSLKHEDFVTFDGSWGAEVDDALDSVSEKHQGLVSSKSRLQKRPRVVSQPPQDSPTLGQGADALPKRSLSLRERVERSRGSPPNASTEIFAEQINWPLKDDGFDLDAEVREMNDKRMSQVSTTSTIVEAMVINSPPRRRQTLRHTGKMIDLTTTDFPTKQLNRDPSISCEQSVRHRLRKSRSPDQELRKSFASDSPEVLSPAVAKRREDYVPVIVIPDRRSSLHSTASGSKRLSNTFSLNSRQQSSRPTTAPEDGVGYFDIPRRERRTLSVVIHSATPVKHENVGEKGIPPSALSKISPTFVPASAEPSTTTSVTSGGLHTHLSSQTPTDQQQATVQLTDVQEAHNLNVDIPTSGEWSAIRPRSTLVTPFSLRSAHSSTPGTLEVNEATAISIYPHTNKSILVIQEMTGGGDSSRPPHHSAVIAGNANIELPGPVTPVIYHESPPRELLHSPLKNPREPPQPPDFKVIPPTPANAPASAEDVRAAPRTPLRTNRFSAQMTSLKRAFSARRPHSESIITPFTRTFSLRGTSSTPRRRPRTAEDRESRLHPFWKPRGFWDDVDGSDSDSEFGNTGVLASRVNSRSSRDITPRRTMSLTRRLTGSLRMPHASRKQRRASVVGSLDQPNYEFFRPNIHNEPIKADRMPRQGYQVQFIGFRGLADKLERRREAKEEGKREERRQWLRGRIDLVGHGEDGEVPSVQEDW